MPSNPFFDIVAKAQYILQDLPEIIWRQGQIISYLNEAQQVLNEKLNIIRRKFYIAPDREYPDNYVESIYAVNEDYNTILIGRKQDSVREYGDSYDCINQSAAIIFDNFSTSGQYEVAPNPSQQVENTEYLDIDDCGVITYIITEDSEPVMTLLRATVDDFITSLEQPGTIPFYGEFGVINYCNGFQFNSDYGIEMTYQVCQNRGFVMYSCNPEDCVMETKECAALIYYVLSKAYMADTDVQNLPKADLYMNLFNIRISKLSGGIRKSNHKDRLGRFY